MASIQSAYDFPRKPGSRELLGITGMESSISHMIQETRSNYTHLKKLNKETQIHINNHEVLKSKVMAFFSLCTQKLQSKDAKFCGLGRKLWKYKINIQFSLSSLSSSTN